ncbi:flagellar hook-length control protein FliK [Vibrio scophthalmi]|uniref:flagellar hook-length control protein FliK n=1 Tax=Vibrio scophthalmi TaxID=45658 RepID=UPI002FF1752A
MNINLSSVSDSGKAAKVAPSTGEASTEKNSGEGFFSKLAALIKGEDGKGDGSGDGVKAQAKVPVEKVPAEKAPTEQASASETSKSTSNSDKSTSTANQSTDELLDAESVSSKADSAKGESNRAASAKVLAATDDSDASLPKDQAAKIVSDNDQVLQRLDESNRALKAKDGKNLPHEANAAKLDPATDTHKVSVEGQVSVQAAAISAQSDEKTQPESFVRSNESEVVRVHGETLHVNSQARDEGQDANAVQAAASSAIVSDGESLDVGDVSEQAKAESAKKYLNVESQLVDSEQDGVSPQVAAAVTASVAAKVGQEPTPTDALPVDKSTQHGFNTEQHQADATAAQNALNASAMTVGTELSEADVDTNRAERAANVSAASLTAESQTVSADTLTDTETPTQATAIPWAVQGEAVVKEEVNLARDPQVKSQQAVLAHSVQQAMHQTQSVAPTPLQQAATSPIPNAAAQAIPTSPIPTDLSASAMPNVAANPALQEQALLKSALGAKVAVGAAQSGESKEAASGEHFAQQLAAASGQQLGTQPNGMRAEQANPAQVPLQLSRDVAADQVAERVQMMMSKNLKNIDIRLDPPELGRLQIRMNMNGDGATVHFTVANQGARDIIEQSMPRLREMLAQQGVQLGDTSVQQQASGQQQGRYATGSGQGNGQGSSNHAFGGEENLEPDTNLDLNVATKRDGISYYA